MSLDREFSENGKELRIFADAKFDFGRVQDFRAAYSNETENVTSIVIDLQRTEYMDSSALGMLLNMQKTMSKQVSSFTIANALPQVLKILQIARFDKKFKIV
jgi:anti-anti-sigma factor